MLFRSASIITTVSLLISTVTAKGQIAQVIDANNFCVFLPPSDSINRIIGDTEWNANAFCLGNNPLATGAESLAQGFIRSAHFVKTETYVQVTGQMDYTKENLVGTDGGGQMDIRAPMGSSCAGWKYYVNLIEPSINMYCMRCCNDDRTCNRGISEKGCAHIIPGDYSGPNDNTGSPIVTNSVVPTASSVPAVSVTSSLPSAVPSITTSTSNISAAATPTGTNTTDGTSSQPSANSPNDATEQSVNGAGFNKPVGLAIGASLLLSSIVLSC